MRNASLNERPAASPAHLPSRRAMREAERRRAANSPWAWIREIATVAVVALIISTILRLFVVQVFYIPSPSMENTLQVNDRIAVSRIHAWTGDINRGDVVVFDDKLGWLEPGETPWWKKLGEFVGIVPSDSTQTLVKRVIAVGGDTVACVEGQTAVEVNGQPISESYVKDGVACTVAFSVTVPDGALWVMGDNRENSADSRFHQSDGESPFVPVDAVVGKAVAIIWPIDRWAIVGDGSSSTP